MSLLVSLLLVILITAIFGFTRFSLGKAREINILIGDLISAIYFTVTIFHCVNASGTKWKYILEGEEN